MATSTKEKEKKTAKAKDYTKSYNTVKHFDGKQYTGMAIGRGHHWDYDQGDWKETKITPDLWEISYAVTKRRRGQAPEGSGVPVGTEYHWYILADQTAKKLNANDYTTAMSGLKFKLAHKRADKDKWNVKGPTQRKHLIKFLKEVIAMLESDPIPLEFDYKGKSYKGEGIPISATCQKGFCYELSITLNDESLGIIRCAKSGWKMDGVEQGLVDAIGQQVFAYFDEGEES
ncbi:hypothetical protein GCM10023231_21190 [Olivibacter ginsenosidimutans]|uniref:Uncharacterized protein n=1 Tax=Olivibacter ginsenosidimutans TaxID=1176537 RepID=A0ABP9BBY3_9SPHI